MRRRVALEKLSERASHTLQQVVRRLGILDEEYGFIRTQIFWVRDQDPIGLSDLLARGPRIQLSAQGLVAAGPGNGQSPTSGAGPRPSSWSRPWPCSRFPLSLLGEAAASASGRA